MSKSVGKHLPGTVPSEKCSVSPDGRHVPDPTAKEWCIGCNEWLGEEDNGDPDICYRCGDLHSPDNCTNPFNCDICDMDGPMDGDQFDYSELDPGIRNSVKFLRNHGFWTTDSGDGQTKFSTGQYDAAEVLDFPHICIVVEPRNMIEESRKLAAVLGGHGVQVQQRGLRHLDPQWYESQDEAPTWDVKQAVEVEASYDPMTDIAVIMVSYINDELLRRYGIGLEVVNVSN